jgi:hypothetical protein
MIDTTAKIWDYFYKIRVPNIESMSVDYIKIFGTPTVGDKAIDKELTSQWFTTMATISTMVDYYKNGINIKIVNYKDIKDIYDAINAHLLGWKKRLEQGINVGNAPIDDLIAMDEFANLVYVHARHEFTRDIVDSLLAQKMSSLVNISKDGFFNRNILSTQLSDTSSGIITINKADEEELPERESISGLLTSRVFGGRRWT